MREVWGFGCSHSSVGLELERRGKERPGGGGLGGQMIAASAVPWRSQGAVGASGGCWVA